MNLKELRELIEIVASEPGIEEFEFERSGVRVRIRQSGADRSALPVEVSRSEPAPPLEAVSESVPQSAGDQAPAEAGLYEITSPMVGTFYRAPSPDAEPFVKVGDFVEKGSVVCIIEAMKLMNEIESEAAGEVVSVRVENGHPVEYGETMICIRPG